MAKKEKKVKTPKEKKPAKKLWGLPVWAWVVIVLVFCWGVGSAGKSDTTTTDTKVQTEETETVNELNPVDALKTAEEGIKTSHEEVQSIIDSTDMTNEEKADALVKYYRDDDEQLYSYLYEVYPDLESLKDNDTYKDAYDDLETAWLNGVSNQAAVAATYFNGNSNSYDYTGVPLYEKYLARAQEKINSL